MLLTEAIYACCRGIPPRRDRVPAVIPANYHDLSVTTEHGGAAIISGATDAFHLAGLIRACRLLPDGGRISPARKPDMPDELPARPGADGPRMVAAGVPAGHLRGWAETPTPTVWAHPWHQISINSCIMGTSFQVKAGIQAFESSVLRGTSGPRLSPI